MISVRVQVSDFDSSAEINKLKNSAEQIGAIVSFLGYVRSDNHQQVIQSLTLEHYPGMTEKMISKIVKAAHKRWHLFATVVIHRIGKLQVNEQIVLVACAAAHRQAAFLACEFIIDFLKTEAAFWKKEQNKDGHSYWLSSKEE